MALSACRECGGNVSTQAGSCPHCGCPNPVGAQPSFRDRIRTVAGRPFIVQMATAILFVCLAAAASAVAVAEFQDMSRLVGERSELNVEISKTNSLVEENDAKWKAYDECAARNPGTRDSPVLGPMPNSFYVCGKQPPFPGELMGLSRNETYGAHVLGKNPLKAKLYRLRERRTPVDQDIVRISRNVDLARAFTGIGAVAVVAMLARLLVRRKRGNGDSTNVWHPMVMTGCLALLVAIDLALLVGVSLPRTDLAVIRATAAEEAAQTASP
jgi:hypothetical protein